MTRRPPIDSWPARDRERWNKGVEPGGLFGGGGAGAGWSDGSRFKTARGYNHWLSWLAGKNILDPNNAPADRVTRERVAAYVAAIQAELSPYSVLCRVQELYDALRVMAPEADWEWLAQLYRNFRKQVPLWSLFGLVHQLFSKPHELVRLVGETLGRGLPRWLRDRSDGLKRDSLSRTGRTPRFPSGPKSGRAICSRVSCAAASVGAASPRSARRISAARPRATRARRSAAIG